MHFARGPCPSCTQEAHLSGPCQEQKSSAHSEQGTETPTSEAPLVQSPRPREPSLYIYSPQYSLGRYSGGVLFSRYQNWLLGRAEESGQNLERQNLENLNFFFLKTHRKTRVCHSREIQGQVARGCSKKGGGVYGQKASLDIPTAQRLGLLRMI